MYRRRLSLTGERERGLDCHELAIATDEQPSRAADSVLDTVKSEADAKHLPDFDIADEALKTASTQSAYLDMIRKQRLGPWSDHDRVGCCLRLKPRSQIRGLTDRGLILVRLAANDDLPGFNSDARIDFHTQALGIYGMGFL